MTVGYCHPERSEGSTRCPHDSGDLRQWVLVHGRLLFQPGAGDVSSPPQYIRTGKHRCTPPGSRCPVSPRRVYPPGAPRRRPWPCEGSPASASGGQGRGFPTTMPLPTARVHMLQGSRHQTYRFPSGWKPDFSYALVVPVGTRPSSDSRTGVHARLRCQPYARQDGDVVTEHRPFHPATRLKPAAVGHGGFPEGDVLCQ